VTIKLYSYWRSSAAYRVRIALNLKDLEHEIVPVSLLPGIAEHRQDAYRKRNPQMLVPFLEDGDVATGQSLAILEYLEETYPEPALLPTDTQQRAAVRSFCNSICCDIHPLNNLRVMQYLKGDLDQTSSSVTGMRTGSTKASRRRKPLRPHLPMPGRSYSASQCR